MKEFNFFLSRDNSQTINCIYDWSINYRLINYHIVKSTASTRTTWFTGMISITLEVRITRVFGYSTRSNAHSSVWTMMPATHSPSDRTLCVIKNMLADTAPRTKHPVRDGGRELGVIIFPFQTSQRTAQLAILPVSHCRCPVSKYLNNSSQFLHHAARF